MECLQCCICHETLNQPVVFECGHGGCKGCMKEYLDAFTNPRCPLCREPLGNFVPCLMMNDCIDAIRSLSGFKTMMEFYKDKVEEKEVEIETLHGDVHELSVKVEEMEKTMLEAEGEIRKLKDDIVNMEKTMEINNKNHKRKLKEMKDMEKLIEVTASNFDTFKKRKTE